MSNEKILVVEDEGIVALHIQNDFRRFGGYQARWRLLPVRRRLRLIPSGFGVDGYSFAGQYLPSLPKRIFC